MSRGYGHLQRAIIAALTNVPYMDTLEIANRVYHGKRFASDAITRSQYLSLNRALLKLSAIEVIEKSVYPSATGHRTWVLLVPPAQKARAAWFAQQQRKNLEA